MFLFLLNNQLLSKMSDSKVAKEKLGRQSEVALI